MNVPVSGSYPAVEFQPSETGSVYHTDQEFTDSNGKSHMYRTYNAQYFSPNWTTLPGGPHNAYATVQDPDGSIHYYWNNGLSSWTSWVGSGNNAVYNAADFGLVSGTGQSQTTRAANVAAIQNAVYAALANIGSTNSGGGTVVIPAGTYELEGTSTLPATIMISNVKGGLVIRGESAGTTLVQYGTPQTGLPNLAADIFDVTNAGNPGQFGVRFRDLTLQYATALALPTAGAVAINCVSGVNDTTAENCGFFNCPQAFAAGTVGAMGGLHCGLIGCTVYQDGNGYSNSTQVFLSGPEAFVLYTDIYQKPMNMSGPTGCTGIALSNGADGCRIYGCHISDVYTGIHVAEGSTFTYIHECKVSAAAGLTIVPAGSTGTIYGVFLTACSFGMIKNYTPPTPTSGIRIDTTGGPNTNVEGIFITDCLAYGYENAGILIVASQSISIIGGKYSSNGSAPITPISGAGIALTGSSAHVRIAGVDCSGIFDFWGTTPQPYGISVASTVANIAVDACDLTGNATQALYVPTAGTDLRVTNCVGYNDQGTIVSNTAPPNATPFNGTYSGFSTPYYGPVTFYVRSGTGTISHIKLNSNDTNLTSGTFSLGPGTWKAEIDYTGGAVNFLMIGQ